MRRESLAEQSASRWDRLAAYYDAVMLPMEWLLLRRWRKRAVAVLPSGVRWLEVGGGPGSNAPFYPPGARGAFTDVSIGMVRCARKRSPVPLLVANAEHLPFRDGTFGGALATLVFCNVPDDHAGLNELRRVVAAAGTLVMIEHVRPESRIGGKAADLLERITGPRGEHMNRRTVENVERAGFALIRVDNILGTLFRLLVAKRS